MYISMKKTYKTKVDWWLLLVLYVAILAPLMMEFSWLAALIVVGCLTAITYFLFSIQYIVEERTLLVSVLSFKEKIDIDSLSQIKASHTWLSAPAASIDRLKLIGKKGSVVISPKAKQEFIDHLLSINPNIKVEV